MQSFYWIFGVLAGAMIPVQTALNARLSRAAGHPLSTAVAVFFVAVLAGIIGLLLLRPPLPALAQWREVPPAAWGGGLIAVIYVGLLVFLAPRLGIGLTTALVLVGQLLAALVIDHFGLLGNPQHHFNVMRLLGLAFMVMGIMLIKRF